MDINLKKYNQGNFNAVAEHWNNHYTNDSEIVKFLRVEIKNTAWL